LTAQRPPCKSPKQFFGTAFGAANAFQWGGGKKQRTMKKCGKLNFFKMIKTELANSTSVDRSPNRTKRKAAELPIVFENFNFRRTRFLHAFWQSLARKKPGNQKLPFVFKPPGTITPKYNCRAA